MICYGIDRKLKELAQQYNCFYTRYADDLTFSTHQIEFPPELAALDLEDATNHVHVGESLQQIIEDNDFRINYNRIRLHNERSRQEVTGIIVNKRLNVPRRYIRNVRAILYSWEKYGLETAEWIYIDRFTDQKGYISPYKGFPSLQSIIRGRIEFIGMVRGKQDRIYKGLLRHYKRLSDPDYQEDASQLGLDVSVDRRVFISYAREDAEFVKALTQSLSNAGVSVWLDTQHLCTGGKWDKEIQQALKICKALIVVITPNSVESHNVEDEWQYFRDENKPIIVIWKQTADLHSQLRRYQRIDFEKT